MNSTSAFWARPTRNERTVFVGDLPYECDETILFNLFRSCGSIETIELKKGNAPTEKNHIGYGFVTFVEIASTLIAINRMNGVELYGRCIRVSAASDERHDRKLKRPPPTFQVHVRFSAMNPHVLITESVIRQVFQSFGVVVDVSIKKVVRKARGQSGYGFVHFPATQEGLRMAYAAISSVHCAIINSVSYECEETHQLKQQSIWAWPMLNLSVGGRKVVEEDEDISDNTSCSSFSSTSTIGNDVIQDFSLAISSKPRSVDDYMEDDHWIHEIANLCLSSIDEEEETDKMETAAVNRTVCTLRKPTFDKESFDQALSISELQLPVTQVLAEDLLQ